MAPTGSFPSEAVSQLASDNANWWPISASQAPHSSGG